MMVQRFCMFSPIMNGKGRVGHKYENGKLDEQGDCMDVLDLLCDKVIPQDGCQLLESWSTECTHDPPCVHCRSRVMAPRDDHEVRAVMLPSRSHFIELQRSLHDGFEGMTLCCLSSCV